MGICIYNVYKIYKSICKSKRIYKNILKYMLHK